MPGYMDDDDEASPSQSGSPALDGKDEKSDETEDKLGLIPKHLFPEQPKPGEEYIFKVVSVYENEVSIAYAYDHKEEEEKEGESEKGMDEGEEADDAMMM